MATSIGDTEIIFGDPRQPNALPLSHPKARWGEFGTLTRVLPKGYIQKRGCLPLPCSMIFERDIPVQLRDGTRIYVDIYRPNKADGLYPAILAWSPYGKQGGRGNQVLDDFPFRMGVPQRKLSNLQKWEGPDPAYWVHHGYAVVSTDPRGVGKSDGNIYQFGSQEGRDGCDVVDWIGSRPWCCGKVALSGNSYLAISQWFIAAERPKYLAAIAPWEGISDVYREGMAAGGVLSKPALSFDLQLLQVNAGEHSWENPVAMAIKYKTFGPYHDDKRSRIEDIEVPAYVVASWTNPIHTYGTFRGYLKLRTEKWLRVHDAWEWPDYYDDQNVNDLRRFFDYYLKGANNGWQNTLKFRAKILDTANPLALTGTYLQSSAFPIPETKYLKLYFDAANKELVPAISESSRLRYRTQGEAVFTYKFAKATTLCGPLSVNLAVSVDGANDADIFIACEKILKNGSIGCQLTVPFERKFQSSLIRFAHKLGVSEADALFYKGPRGQVRLSRRVLESNGHIEGFPVARMEEYHPLKEGDIVAAQPMMTPIGMHFAEGEGLKIRFTGVDTGVYPPVDQSTLTVEGLADINGQGEVLLHSHINESLGSFIILPCI